MFLLKKFLTTLTRTLAQLDEFPVGQALPPEDEVNDRGDMFDIIDEV